MSSFVHTRKTCPGTLDVYMKTVFGFQFIIYLIFFK